jgi:hypothetical protein
LRIVVFDQALGQYLEGGALQEMSRVLTVLAVQGRGVPFDPPASLGKLEGEVERAAQHFPNADLLVFPELYLTGDDPFTGGEPRGFLRA